MEENKEKELEMALEEKKLEYTKKIINNEILKYVEKRKQISQYILDYRKDVIEEFKDDEDKVMEYFDHERFVKEEAFKTIDRRLKELTILLSSPYFGKVTFVEEGDSYNEKIYIGKFGVTPEGSYEPVIVDWRAPVASLFYAGTLGKASYKSPAGKVDTDIIARRQFIIKRGSLAGMFDSELDVKDEILQMVLSKNSGDKLKDIIMSIQKEQDEIIREPRNEVIVVNGVAGSGKTTIALHRVAYLLYNYRDKLQDKVLILGPNGIFMEYISNVLPSLGESGVKQNTFRDFAIDILKPNHKVMDFKTYIEKVLNGEEELIKDIKYKSSKAYKAFLDESIEDLNNNYFSIKDVVFKGEVVVSAEEIKDMFFKHYANMPLFRRNKRIKRVFVSRIRDKRDEHFREIEKKYRELKASLTPEELNNEGSEIEFRRRLEIRELIREVIKAREELSWIDNENIEVIYNRLNNNKPLIVEDLAPMLYLKQRLEEIKLKEEYRHVVIDEAQDYSELQFEVIKAITKCNSFTIVGDSNQRIISFEEEPAMINLNAIFGEDYPIKYFNLNKSYRSTEQIMDHANKYLKEEKIVPFVREGKEVESISFKDKDSFVENIKETIENFQKEGNESIAIICRNQQHINYIEGAIKEKIHVVTMTSEDLIYKSGVVLIPSYFAKGLEFDAAIVVDIVQESSKEEPKEDLIKYIMCTRALHELKEVNLDITP